MKRNWMSTKADIFGKQIPLPGVLLLLLCTLVVFGFSVRQAWQNIDQWKTFNSNRKYYTQEHPNFQLAYPTTWKYDIYQGYFRSTDDVWADFGGFGSGLRLYWRSIENPTINEFSLWGQEIIEIYQGYNVSQLQDMLVGVEDYPAFIQTLQGSANHTYIIVYILNEEEGYLLLFNAKQYNVETENAFRQILASFQILETQE